MTKVWWHAPHGGFLSLIIGNLIVKCSELIICLEQVFFLLSKQNFVTNFAIFLNTSF